MGKRILGLQEMRGGRLNEHMTSAKKGSIVLKNAIRKHGKQHFQFEVLALCSSQEYVQELERKAVALFNTKVPCGYNLTNGGEGIPGYKHTEEAKEKIRQTSLKKRHSPETRAKMCAIQQCLVRTRTHLNGADNKVSE